MLFDNDVMLISIQPDWVHKILSGLKNIEIRKTMPKLMLPIVCYVYITKNGKIRSISTSLDKLIGKVPKGKIAARFIINNIDTYEYRYGRYEIDDESLKQTFLTQDELFEYGKGKTLYGYHISQFEMFEKPYDIDSAIQFKVIDGIICKKHRLRKPPQNYCYIRGLV